MFRISVLTILWTWCIALTLLASSAAAEPKRWALLIGVDDYVEAADLGYCGADQQALKTRLIAAGFPEDRAFRMDAAADEKRYLPIKSNIEKQLDVVLALAKKDDLLVLAFSGHGFCHPLGSRN